MDQPSNQRWFLRKHEDGGIFGPLSFKQLAHWASTAQIAPHDAISSDQMTWMKAPMLPELGMDWLVELTTESYYGPTTLGAIQEFIRLGEIDGETFIINSCDGTRRQIQEMSELLQTTLPEVEPETGETTDPHAISEPVTASISIDLQDRIRNLEQSLREERRALEEAEERYRNLERRYRDLEEKASSGST
jgi:hypothetical protein